MRFGRNISHKMSAKGIAQVYYGNPIANPIGVTVKLDPFWVVQARVVSPDPPWVCLKVWTKACQGRANYWINWQVAERRFAASAEWKEFADRQPVLVPLLRNACTRHGAEWLRLGIAQGRTQAALRGTRNRPPRRR